MRAMRLILLALAATLLAGCAATPLPNARTRAPSDTHGLAMADAVKQTNHTVQHLSDDKSIVYTQNFGGGGVALGLLGPFGVAANISMIESVTKADVAKLSGKVKIDPAALFRDAVPAEQLVLQPAGVAAIVRLTPYLLIVKVDETTLSPAAGLFVEAPGSDGKPWTTRYAFQLPGKHSIDTLASLDDKQLASLREDLRTAYKELTAFYLRDTQELSAREGKIVFKSAFVNPRFDFEMAGSLVEQPGAMTWLRTYNGVFALQKDGVSYKVQK